MSAALINHPSVYPTDKGHRVPTVAGDYLVEETGDGHRVRSPFGEWWPDTDLTATAALRVSLGEDPT